MDDHKTRKVLRFLQAQLAFAIAIHLEDRFNKEKPNADLDYELVK